jgi:hypothetical protein
MIILSTLRYGETVYGSASKVVLRKMDHIHHIGVRLAFRTFAVCKTQNILCEAGLSKLKEMRDKKTMKKIDEQKPPFQITNDKPNIYDDYAMKPGSPKSFFIRAAELLGQMKIDGRKSGENPPTI